LLLQLEERAENNKIHALRGFGSWKEPKL